MSFSIGKVGFLPHPGYQSVWVQPDAVVLAIFVTDDTLLLTYTNPTNYSGLTSRRFFLASIGYDQVVPDGAAYKGMGEIEGVAWHVFECGQWQ